MRFFFGRKPNPDTQESASQPPARPRVVPPPQEAAPAPDPVPVPGQGAGPEAGGKARDISMFQALLSGLYDGVLILDAKGFVIACNQRIAQFTGFTEAELWNMPCSDLIASLTPRVLAKITAYVESGRFTVVNADCRRKDGEVFSAEIAISRIHFLNEGDFVFSIRNLDRRAKARLRHELEMDALGHAMSGVSVCALDGTIEYANPSFARLLNAGNEKDLVRRNIADFLASRETAAAIANQAAAQGFWLGRLDLQTLGGLSRAAVVSVGLCPAKSDAPARLVLTLTPLPAAVEAAPAPRG